MDITVKELKARIDAGTAPAMIDVREPFEWEMGHLAGVQKISLGSLSDSLGGLAGLKDQEIVMICRSGGRSGRAAAFMRDQGFMQVRNLTGGMLAWRAEIDPQFHVE
jgi:rhodanese-related sulfurtransferase